VEGQLEEATVDYIASLLSHLVLNPQVVADTQAHPNLLLLRIPSLAQMMATWGDTVPLHLQPAQVHPTVAA
jgi:hypothetical protein